MNHAHMKRRCPKTVFLGPALLEKYSLAFRYPSTSFPGGGAADIIHDPGKSLWGGLWKSNKEDFERLDAFEDVALGGYKRLQVSVIFDGKAIRATTHEVVDKLSGDWAPVKKYQDLLLSGAKDCRLPEKYIKQITF